MVHQLPGFELTHGATQELKNKSCLPYPFRFWVLITGSYQRQYWILLAVLFLLKSMDTTQGRPARERPGVLLFTRGVASVSLIPRPRGNEAKPVSDLHKSVYITGQS